MGNRMITKLLSWIVAYRMYEGITYLKLIDKWNRDAFIEYIESKEERV